MSSLHKVLSGNRIFRCEFLFNNIMITVVSTSFLSCYHSYILNKPQPTLFLSHKQHYHQIKPKTKISFSCSNANFANFLTMIERRSLILIIVSSRCIFTTVHVIISVISISIIHINNIIKYYNFTTSVSPDVCPNFYCLRFCSPANISP